MLKKICQFLAVGVLCAISGRAQMTFQWTNLVGGAANGSWTNVANWSPAGPVGGTGNTVQFNLPVTTSATLTLDGSLTVGNLFFGNTSASAIGWTINPGTPGSSALTLAVVSGTPTITVTNQSATLGAVLAGTQGFTLSGGGTLNLNVADTYAGLTTVNSGALVLNHLNSIAAGNSVNIANGAVLQPKLGGTYANVPTTINGVCVAYGSFGGALDFHSGGTTTVTWPGQINLNAPNATIGSYGVTYTVTLAGQLTGSGGFTLRPEGGNPASHTSTFIVSNPTNNYAGSTTVQVGTAQLSSTLKLGATNGLPVTTTLNLNRAGSSGVVYFDLGGFSQTVAGLSANFNSNAVFNSSGTVATLTVSNSANATFNGVIGTSGKAGIHLVKQGGGTLTLNNTNIFTGGTTLGGGTLALNGSITATASLLMSSNATFQPRLGGAGGAASITVVGNATLAGQINVSDFGIVSNTSYPVIFYNGTLTNNGIMISSSSPWGFSIVTNVPNVVSLVATQKFPLAQFSASGFAVSTLTTNLSGILRGTPVSPIWYEVRDQTNRLWDFGATPAVSPWNITVRHLRAGTNTITIFAKDNTGSIQSNSIQLTLTLGNNPPVRPRPQPAEIWWGGSCHDNLYDANTNIIGTYSRLTQLMQTNGWDFVKRHADGFLLHGYVWVNGVARMTNWQSVGASISAQLAPFNGKYWLEDAWQPPTNSMNYGHSSATSQTNNAANMLGVGFALSEITEDFNPKYKDFSAWHPDWPTNNIRVLVTGHTNQATPAYPYASGLWRDFANDFHAARPDIKFGWTWSPVWFHWLNGPSLGNDDGIFSINSSGTNYNFNWDFYDFMNDAVAIGNQTGVPFTFSSDCPWDYYGKNPGNPGGWSLAHQLANRVKIRSYEVWLQNQNLRHTMICNYSQMNPADTNASDLTYETNSLNTLYLHQQEGGRATRYLLESWYQGPYTLLPETKPGSYTHLALTAIKYLKGIADTNGALENLTLTLLSTNGGTNTITITNRGDVMCLPAIAGFETGTGAGTVNYYDSLGSNITSAILSPEGWTYTNRLTPGQATTIRVVPSVLPLNRAITLEAFWNPQDPTGVVRDRLVLTPPNTPPVLNAISNRTVMAGATLTFTNLATDTNVPTQTLTFSLLSPPAGAMINPASGIFSWRPTIAQSPSTNPMSVKVADNGTPSLGATQSFSVFVLRPAPPVISAPALSNGAFGLTVAGDAGPDYALSASTNLLNWSLLQQSNSPVLPFRFVDPAATNFSQRFYRIQLLP